jgi:hypothetical protein
VELCLVGLDPIEGLMEVCEDQGIKIGDAEAERKERATKTHSQHGQ